jgi:hypothetical protein
VAPCFEGFFSAGLFSFTGFDDEDFFAFVEDFDFFALVVVVVDEDELVVVDDEALVSAANEGAAMVIATANARKVIRRRMARCFLPSNHDAGEPQSSGAMCSSVKPGACGSSAKRPTLLTTEVVSSFSRTRLLF